MSTRPAEITTPYGWAEAIDGIRATRADITDTRAWITARIEHYRDLRDSNPSTEPATPNSEAGKGTEPEKGTDAMHPDEQQRRRDDLVVEEQERQQRDLLSDGVLDGDENPEPGDGGTADLELEG